MNRFRNLIAVFAFSLVILGLPAIASAQFGNDRNNRNDDEYNCNNDYYGGYNNRALQSTIRNLKNDSRQFARELDNQLDRSRINGSNREDQLNQLAKDFARAADRLDDRFDNGRDLNRSQNEARRVLDLGSQVERALSRARLNNNLDGYWDRINQELRAVANAYNYNYNNRSDRNRRNDRNRRSGNDNWWNNLPFLK